MGDLEIDSCLLDFSYFELVFFADTKDTLKSEDSPSVGVCLALL